MNKASASGLDPEAVHEDLQTMYSPLDTFGVPVSSHVLVNGIRPYVIRHRMQDGITAVPDTALRYLRAYASASDHLLAKQEAWAYGWGIRHPAHSVVTYLRAVVENKPRWVRSTLELAFYADQDGATALLKGFVTDDSIEFSVQPTPKLTVPKERFLVECLVGPDADTYRPLVPRYWPWWEEFGVIFDWDSSIEARLRELKLGLPTGWTFQDLRF